MTLSTYICERRKALGLTREEAAERAGMQLAFYRCFEMRRSGNLPHADILKQLADALEVKPIDLLKASDYGIFLAE